MQGSSTGSVVQKMSATAATLEPTFGSRRTCRRQSSSSAALHNFAVLFFLMSFVSKSWAASPIYSTSMGGCKEFNLTADDTGTLEVRQYATYFDTTECMRVTVHTYDEAFNVWTLRCFGDFQGNGSTNKTVVPTSVCETVSIEPLETVTFRLEYTVCNDNCTDACNCTEYVEEDLPSLSHHYAYVDEMCGTDTTCPSPPSSATPTLFPVSAFPTDVPSSQPSKVSSSHPSDLPSVTPSSEPSKEPSDKPSDAPSRGPSKAPTTFAPSKAPQTSDPTAAPQTSQPVTATPSKAPQTSQPTKAPQPTSAPATSAPTEFALFTEDDPPVIMGDPCEGHHGCSNYVDGQIDCTVENCFLTQQCTCSVDPCDACPDGTVYMNSPYTATGQANNAWDPNKITVCMDCECGACGFGKNASPDTSVSHEWYLEDDNKNCCQFNNVNNCYSNNQNINLVALDQCQMQYNYFAGFEGQGDDCSGVEINPNAVPNGCGCQPDENTACSYNQADQTADSKCYLCDATDLIEIRDEMVNTGVTTTDSLCQPCRDCLKSACGSPANCLDSITFFDIVSGGQCNDLTNAFCCFKAMDAQSTGNNPSCRTQCNNECTKRHAAELVVRL